MYSMVNLGRQKLCIVGAVAMAIEFIAGCGPGYYIEKIQRSSGDRGWLVHKLADYPRDEHVTVFLIDLLGEENPAVRYFAAESLDRHIKHCGKELAVRALTGLIAILDDSRIAMVSWPAYGPFLPGMSGFTGSVRSRALLTLTIATNKDFGFDQEAWNAYMRERFPESVGSGEDNAPG